MSFNVYIMPTKNIDPGASDVTGLTVQQGELHLNGKPVPTKTCSQSLIGLMDFLRTIDKPILAGHNIKRFDVPVLTHSLQRCHLLAEFRQLVSGFLDTYGLAKASIPKDDIPEQKYTQQALVSAFLKKTYEAHNALADVTALEELYLLKLEPTPAEMENAVFSVNYVACLQSLQNLVSAKVISADISRRLACAGLGYLQLKLVHQRDPDSGISAIFKQPATCNPKQVRITRSSKIIGRVRKVFEV